MKEVQLSITGMFGAYDWPVGVLVTVERQTYEIIAKPDYTRLILEGPLAWYWVLYHQIKSPFVRRFPKWIK